ncbi:unnamed protein product [Timema podura]|uniref:Uncharacterized protein n=1 Tax=Timema podura TaxID=61482 RepID=A0ABN7NU48_TIMPD|nr:unnamed protein product [Timema podura]
MINFFLLFTDQQYYFSNSAQPSFVPSFQSTPRQQQYEDYFRQSQNPSHFSPFSSQQAAPTGFQQNQRLPHYDIPPSLQPTPFQLPPSSSAPTSHFDTFQSDHFHPSHQETPPHFPQQTFGTKFSNNPPAGTPSNIQPSLSFSGVGIQEYNNARHPQTFPNQAPSAQATIKRPQTFLDQITLSPSGFSGGLPQPQRNTNNLRLIQGFPDIERPQGLVDQFSPAPQKPRRPQNNFFAPSAPQEVKKPTKFVPEEIFEINTNIDQNLEVDDGITNDSRTKANPPTTARSRDQVRKADAALRRKPGTKPQPGSRGNFLTPKNSRQNESQGRGTTKPRNIPSGPVQANYDDYTYDSLPPSGRGRSKTRQEGRYRQSTTQPTQPQTHRTRSNRFTPTTKPSTKARQINIRPTKVPFLPKRVLATSTTEAEQVVDDDYSADFPDYVENEKATFVESSLVNTTYDDLHTKYNSQTVPNLSEIEEGQSNATLTAEPGTETGVNVDGDTTTFISNSVDESSTYQNEENTTMTENISPQEDVSDYINTDDQTREITSTGHDEVVELSSTGHEDVSTTQEDSSVLTDNTATVLNLEDHFILLPEKDHILPSQDHSIISNNTRTFDVLTMNPDHTLVEEDNFKGFVDSVLIDATDRPQLTTMETDDITEEAGVVTVSVNTSVTMKTSTSKSLIPLIMNGHPIEEAVVSVVTTKSVINNAVIMTSTAQPEQTELDQVLTPHPAMIAVENITSNPTESWFIIASVQTSRSVSGARFLPSSDVKQEERPISSSGKALDEDELANDELDELASTEDPKLIPETNRDTSDPSINKTVSNEAMPPSLDSGASTSESVSKTSAASTESIIDKLDRVQSELSSGILTGGFRNGANKLQLEVLTEMSSDKPGDIMPMGRPLNMTTSTTTDTTPTTTTTYKSPVFIRRFEPHSSRSTAKPKKLTIENLPMDDLSGLLPAGFKPRTPARRTTTSTQSPDSIDMPQGDEPPKPSLPITGFKLRSATGRLQNGKPSNIGASKNKAQVQDPISSLLPPGFKPKEDNGTVSNEKPKELPVALGKIKFETPTSLLPPGYKPPIDNGTTEKPKRLEDLFKQIQVDDIASLLPPGYKPPPEEPSTTVKPKAIENLLSVAKPVDINAFLPPGFSLPDSTTEKLASTVLDALLDKVKFQDVSLLLPPGFKPETNTSLTAVPTRPPLPTTAAGSKVVFPSRPGGARKPITRTSTTAKPADAPEVTVPKINKGWPIR